MNYPTRQISCLSTNLLQLLRHKARKPDIFNVSCAQQRLWFFNQLISDNLIYNPAVVFRLIISTNHLPEQFAISAIYNGLPATTIQLDEEYIPLVNEVKGMVANIWRMLLGWVNRAIAVKNLPHVIVHELIERAYSHLLTKMEGDE